MDIIQTVVLNDDNDMQNKKVPVGAPAGKILCKNCGAQIDELTAYCPYCGAMNYQGAEREYFEKLDDIKDDMADMADASEREMKTTGKRGARVFAIAVAIAAAVVLALIAVIKLNDARMNRQLNEYNRARLIWKNTYFAVLDEMYENEDYDGILEFLDEHCNDEGYAADEWPTMVRRSRSEYVRNCKFK